MSDLVLTEEQELLRQTAADFVRQHAPLSRVRQLRDSDDPTGFSGALWRAMSALGWPGIVLPEVYGGLGLGYAELVVVLEELGAALAPEPFLSSVLLGGNAILLGGREEQRRTILPRIASGEEILALAHHEPHARHDLQRVATRIESQGDSLVLHGEKDLVLDGIAATRLVVSARSAGSTSARSGIEFFLVDPQARGVLRQRQHLLDGRVAARILLDGVVVADADRIGEPGRGADLLEPTVDRALVGLAAEMLGGMRRAFEMTLAYLKEREQFGVKIGSFQALKHRAARLFVQLELGRSTVMAAARAIDDGSGDVSRLASLAKAQLSDAFVQIASEALQMHGGIGMTDEHDIGFFLKRARVAEMLLGDAAHHRDRYARLEGF